MTKQIWTAFPTETAISIRGQRNATSYNLKLQGKTVQWANEKLKNYVGGDPKKYLEDLLKRDKEECIEKISELNNETEIFHDKNHDITFSDNKFNATFGNLINAGYFNQDISNFFVIISHIYKNQSVKDKINKIKLTDSLKESIISQIDSDKDATFYWLAGGKTYFETIRSNYDFDADLLDLGLPEDLQNKDTVFRKLKQSYWQSIDIQYLTEDQLINKIYENFADKLRKIVHDADSIKQIVDDVYDLKTFDGLFQEMQEFMKLEDMNTEIEYLQKIYNEHVNDIAV
jgi:hypothetical protein